jgi:serine protease AprX
MPTWRETCDTVCVRTKGTPAPSTTTRTSAPSRVVVALATSALLVVGAFAVRAAAAVPSGVSHVIVRTLPGHERAVQHEVLARGGTVGLQLPLIHGFSAAMPTRAVAALAVEPSVLAVSPDGTISLFGTGNYQQSSDPYSMRNVEESVRATSMWAAGYTGAGVDIALIDSGVAPVQGLTGPGKVLNGPDLSFESQNPNQRYLDTFGHGTHMAGIIAGRDDAAIGAAYATDTTDFLGMAPDARIVSIKVANAYGNADVSQVIAAIDWAVQHAHDPGMNIRVLNLSFGTASSQTYVLDPLAFAAEAAWRQGLTVVAAVGNAGISANGLADPAYDPFVIAAGAADHHGTGQYSQWDVATFSQAGDGIRNPNILAPGAHIQSLRDPGSSIDQTYPSGVINDRFFRGSGSSQAAAVISGALALMFQEHPSMSPDQAKALMKDQANPLRRSAGFGPKQGQLAIRLDTMASASVPTGTQSFVSSTGLGTLEGSRGPAHLVKDGVALQGEQDIFGHAFNAPEMAVLEAAGNSWSGGVWNGNVWSGNSWSGNSWQGSAWAGTSWDGNSWASNTWSGNSWQGNSWTGNSWASNSWDSNSWTGNSWASALWG